MKNKQITLFLFVLFSTYFFAQNHKSENFSSEIKNYDISSLLTVTHIKVDDNEIIEKAKPIGFIGNDFQRFYIHFSSIVKNSDSKYEYFITGKTMVKDVIRPFQGTLKIIEANIEKDEEFPGYTHGFATCEVAIFEDKNLTSTGFIKGTMTVGYVLDSKNKMSYDSYLYYTDGFSNNEFKGTWTSYRTKVSKKCNWGDYRIPQSGDLDIGAGEFSPNPKYFDKGWKYYSISLRGDSELGKKKEAEAWWNNK